MTEVLSEKDLRSQLAGVLRGRQARFVGLHSRARWEGNPEIRCDDQTFEVCQVQSVLEFYERLIEAEDRGANLVFLTEMDSRELGLDLLTRLYKRRLHSVDRWTAVKSRFRAQGIEASLLCQGHLARYLVDYEPPEGYAPVKVLVLTAAKAWSCLFRYALGMPSEYLDGLSLLQWASGDTAQYRAAPEDLKKSARERVAHQCGELGDALMASVDCERVNPLALGLALRCVFPERPDPPQQTAAVRLERYLMDRPLSPELGREWASAAEHLYQEDLDALRLREAEEILAELKIEDYAHLSDLLPASREQRLARFGEALARALDDPGQLAQLDSRSALCARHRGLNDQERRRLEMAPRLLRWLQQPAPTTDRLGDWARYHLSQGAFAEWARLRCEGSDATAAAAQGFRTLGERVLARLEEESRAFALACQAWNQSGEAAGAVLGVEEMLQQVVRPLAATKGGRVLLIVLDGCNWATMHELLSELPPFWTLRRPQEGPLLPMLATFPSVTEHSRTSLLSGALVSGQASTELQNFRDHVGLREVSSSGYPPALFHKADLDGEFGRLAEPVETRVLETRSKVVAVVINAIDDHLDRDDQLERTWDMTSIKHLLTLLDLAFKSGRTVIFASDHGHTLERGAELRPGEKGGARWQTGRAPGEGEIELCGRRVLCGADSVVMPWSEKIRYTKKKNGYHGGAHPRELVAPLIVMAPQNRQLEGWVEIPHEFPSWWTSTPTSRPRPRVRTERPTPATGQLTLFEETPAPDGPLAQAILDFPLVQEQWKQLGDKAPPKGWVLSLLQMLEDRGRRAPVAELAAALKQPEVRFRELLARVGPVLGIDGIPVVGLTPDLQGVFLNPAPFQNLGATPSRSGSGTRIEVETTAGRNLSFSVPVKKLTPVERLILEGLGRYGQMTESELKKHTGTRRVSGAVERLMEKLHKAGFTHVTEAAAGEQGRVYALNREAL